MLYVIFDFVELLFGEDLFMELVCFCIVGDMSCMGVVVSWVVMLFEVVVEIVVMWIIECGEMCVDDCVIEVVMEDCKKEGYF